MNTTHTKIGRRSNGKSRGCEGGKPHIHGTDRATVYAAWEKEQNLLAGKTTLALIKDLALSSAKDSEEILKRDKKTSREDLKKAGEIYRPIIVRRLAAGAVVLAEIWRRHSNWQPNEEKFFSFTGEPAYIESPKAVPTPTPAPKPPVKKAKEELKTD